MSHKMTRRTFLKAAFNSSIVFGAAGGVGYIYGSRFEPYDLDIIHVDCAVKNLPSSFEGFTIAQISDTHFGNWMTIDQMQKIVAEVNALNADMIAVTGDYVHEDYPLLMEELLDGFKNLHAPEGVYGCLGNHDYWANAQMVTQALEEVGVRMLVNVHTQITRGEDTLYIAAVDDVWVHRHDLARTLNGIPEQGCIVLMAHEPDYADRVAANGRVALQLSGHSHGGQIRLPGYGSPGKGKLAVNYDMGLYSIKDMKLYVNRGVGMVPPNVRINCNPEITLLRLVST